VGSVKGRGVLFRVLPNDHPGAPVPHVHAWIGAGEVVIELMPDRTVRLSERHPVPVRGDVKRSEVRKALNEAAEHYDASMSEHKRQG
jgi:hypothetical protein